MPLKPWQCLVYLFQDEVRGIRKNKGAFSYVISIRSVNSKDDGRTATPTFIPDKVQDQLTKRILKEIPEVVRVVFDKTPKPPGSIEYE